MMSRKLYTLLLVLSVATMFSTFSDAGVVQRTGKVKEIWLFSNNYDSYSTNETGVAIIYMDELDGACNTPEKRVAISSDHPQYKAVVAAALQAKALSAPVELWYVDKCTVRYNAWDFALFRIK